MNLDIVRNNKSIRTIYKRLRSFLSKKFCHNRFKKRGYNNRIVIAKYCYFNHCEITVKGTNNIVSFGENCYMRGLKVLIIGDGNIISFGKNVIVNASSIQPTIINSVGGGKIVIGDGSLFSNNIEIHNTDYHGIYNFKGERINPEKDIEIGKSVWVGLGSKILKGTEIADNVVVGCGSLVTGQFTDSYVIIAGNPAKIVKTGVFWNHMRKERCELSESKQTLGIKIQGQ